MEYIDKHITANSRRFEATVDGFIAGGKIHYKDLDANERGLIRGQIASEQQGHCAFCMQNVAQEGTSEHVIPQYITLQDFKKAYRLGRYYPEFIHQSTFNAALQPRCYPHTLAYGNIVLACAQCNQKKGTDVIVPTFYNNPTGVSYRPDGTAVFPQGALTVNICSMLNYRVYCNIRALWRTMKVSGISVCQVLSVGSMRGRRELLKAVSPNMKGELARQYSAREIDFIKDAFWRLFVSFDWFWGYY